RIPDEVQVIEPPRPGGRRRYTAQEKLSFLQEAEAPGSSISAVARRYGIAPSQLFRWRHFRNEGTLTSLGAGGAVVVPESELRARIRELPDGRPSYGYRRTTALLQGKTLGIVGLGNIGSRVAEIGRAFGMKVIAGSRPDGQK